MKQNTYLDVLDLPPFKLYRKIKKFFHINVAAATIVITIIDKSLIDLENYYILN